MSVLEAWDADTNVARRCNNWCRHLSGDRGDAKHWALTLWCFMVAWLQAASALLRSAPTVKGTCGGLALVLAVVHQTNPGEFLEAWREIVGKIRAQEFSFFVVVARDRTFRGAPAREACPDQFLLVVLGPAGCRRRP